MRGAGVYGKSNFPLILLQTALKKNKVLKKKMSNKSWHIADRYSIIANLLVHLQ